jgi:hypothetical protein
MIVNSVTTTKVVQMVMYIHALLTRHSNPIVGVSTFVFNHSVASQSAETG